MLAGFGNGLLITRIKLPPFIVTLGTLGIFTSLTLLYATGRTVRDRELPAQLKWLGHPIDLGGFRLTYGRASLMLVLYADLRLRPALHRLGLSRLRRRRRPGRRPARRHRGQSGAVQRLRRRRPHLSRSPRWILIGRVGAASPNSGIDANLDSITAVVIGGTSLFGGRGRVIGTLIGALIVGVVDNGLSLAGLDQAYKQLAIGVLVIVAVTADQWIRRARA